MTVAINHHLVINDEEQYMIVNALTFFYLFYKYNGDEIRKETINEWQDVADDSHIRAFDLLASKIANSN